MVAQARPRPSLHPDYVARLEAEAEAAFARRKAEAVELAHSTAGRLRDEFGATRVLLIGSLAKGYFGRYSDVDLLAFGIPYDRRLEAMADLSIRSDDPRDLGIDVLCAEEMRRSFVETALEGAVVLHGG